jgi:RecA/RadA recombinase
MAKRVSTEKSQKSSFSELNDMLSKFSPDGAIIEDSIYAKIDEWIPTGSYILNAALSGSLFGGMPNRRSLMFAGQEGTGKTYLACSIVRSAQAMDYFPIYYDSEGSIDVDFVKRLGIDTTKFRIENVNTIEEFATLAAKLNETIATIRGQGKTPPKIMVVLDSLGNLSSTKEKEDTTAGSGKRDMTKQQSIRRMFRVIGTDFAKNGIPFIICNHVYAAIGGFRPGDEISGGGGTKYNSSIIFVLSKSKLSDKDSEEHVKNQGLDKYTKVGIVVTVHPFKQRFARPIKVQIHIPFYKKPNPYVGLEKFVNWDTCGIVRGNMITPKEFNKLPAAEQKKCRDFLIPQEGLKIGDDGTRYAQSKDTARKLVCEHLHGEVPIAELYTPKVFTEEVLHLLDDNIIKKTFMLPSIESLEDLAEVTGDLMDDAEMGDINIGDDNGVEDFGEFSEEPTPYEI